MKAVIVEVRCQPRRPNRQSQMESHAANMRSANSFETLSTKKASNMNYEADVKHTLRYTRGFFRLLGVWSMVSRNPTKMERNFSKFMRLVCLLTPAFILVPSVHYMIINEQTVIAQIVLATPLGFHFANFVKYLFIIFRCRMIKFCIEHMRTDWMMIEGEKERATMKMNIKVGHNITVICSAFLYTCGFSYHTVMPLSSGKTINKLNETVRPLAYPGYDAFFDSQSSPNYEITFFIICVSAFVGFTISNATCNFAAVFVTHTCGQVQILISRLGRLDEEFDECDKNGGITERLSFVIRCHIRALRLASNIQIILAEICFIEVLSSMVTMCLIEYCCMMELKNSGILGLVTYFTSFLSESWNIYIFCHIGELLKEQFHKIGAAAYMVQWYRLPRKIALDLIMIMIMASSPRKITAGNMMELSISSFGYIMKMSMTYFNVLRRLAD